MLFAGVSFPWLRSSNVKTWSWHSKPKTCALRWIVCTAAIPPTVWRWFGGEMQTLWIWMLGMFTSQEGKLFISFLWIDFFSLLFIPWSAQESLLRSDFFLKWLDIVNNSYRLSLVVLAKSCWCLKHMTISLHSSSMSHLFPFQNESERFCYWKPWWWIHIIVHHKWCKNLRMESSISL